MTKKILVCVAFAFVGSQICNLATISRPRDMGNRKAQYTLTS